MVLRAIGQQELSAYFRDDCLVAALLSESAAGFVEECRHRIVRGDFDLLARLIHVLRVACKESPWWLDAPGLPSQMLVPTGAGWVPALGLVLDFIDSLLPERAQLVLGLVEDWGKRVDWVTPAPDGMEQAGAIIDRLLPEFDGYGSDDARERALKVLVRIPGAVPLFNELIERSKTCDYSDRLASGLRELILRKPEGGFACRDFPDEVISLVEARIRLSDADREWNRSGMGLEEINYGFGVREVGIGSYHPASALQGPFGALLRCHPRKAVAFILRLVNHAGDWYATEQWLERILEPASRTSLEIPNRGTVEHWANGRLYSLYRGNQVAPGCIVSALMALESWLLWLGEAEGANLESWLLYVLENSNNVMATGVVASVCVAYPEKAGQAGLALLSSRDVVQFDRERLALESSAASTAFFGLDPHYRMFEQERSASNELPHRREDLESLAVRMQLTERRDGVWAIIDRHRSEASVEPGEDTRVWRLALHRMDIRDFEPQNAPEGTEDEGGEDPRRRIFFGPGKMEPDVQEMVDETAKSFGSMDRYVKLQNLARKMWRQDPSVGEVDWKTSLLAEAQAVERELDEAEEFYRDGQGFAAAACIRDHLGELGETDFEWCARRVDFEVRRRSETADHIDRVGRMMTADRVCASVVPVLAVHPRKVDGVDAMALLSLSLTHPIEEVSEYAFSGLGTFVGEEHRALVLKCVAAAAYRSRLTALWEKARRRRTMNAYGGEDPFGSIVPPVRAAIARGSLDVAKELGSLRFDEPLAGGAIRAVLTALERHSDWEESREFYSRIAHWLVDTWRADKHSPDGTGRDYHLVYAAVQSLARFVLCLPWTEASRISAPVVDTVADRREDAEHFVAALIMSADGNTNDCFWELWQRLADEIAGSPWGLGLTNAHSYGLGLLHTIFLCRYWKEDVKHWNRLDGHAHRLDKLARNLPATVPVLFAYSDFLRTIGQQSLPGSFEVVAHVLAKGDAVRIATDSGVAFNLEILLRPFVYSQPHRLKTDPQLREAVLVILDALVAGGSPSAYRMRDDFVTPSSQG